MSSGTPVDHCHEPDAETPVAIAAPTRLSRRTSEDIETVEPKRTPKVVDPATLTKPESQLQAESKSDDAPDTEPEAVDGNVGTGHETCEDTLYALREWHVSLGS
jgi:hypothetical protein